MTRCRECAGLRFVWGWGHGPPPFCEAHQLQAKAARWFRIVWARQVAEAHEQAAARKGYARERRLERRRQRRAQA